MAFLVALVVWIVALGLAIPFFTQWWWMPPAITEHARAVDSQFNLTLLGTGIIFIVAQAALGYAVFRFGRKRSEPADYVHGSDRWEVLWTAATTIMFVGLTLMGYTVWAEARFLDDRNVTPSADRIVIEVTGQQFVWNMRYPGADGKFGPLDLSLVDDAMGNALGINRSHPDAKDDVVTPRMAVPVNKEVDLILRTKDVLHNFFVPELRIKLDTVPGLIGRLHFKADKVGTYTVACSELCGLGHHEMGSYLDVMEQADFDKWMADQSAYLQY
ncbi:MAG: cytochrome c oxidase subunit II [Bryobacterales bacterium]